MKKLFVAFVALMASVAFEDVARAEDQKPFPHDFFAAGVGYSPALPWFAYGHLIGKSVYNFDQVTVSRLSGKPVQVETRVTAGICEVRMLGEYFVLGGCIKDGPAFSGSQKGNVVGGTPFAAYRFGKSQHFAALVGGDLFHSTLDKKAGFESQVFAGFTYGWGAPK